MRPQGPPPLSPRYPINNGSVGGARLGGQQAPILHRLDSRSSLGSPTAPGGQFVQSRPPFGPPRPQNPQGVHIQGPRPPPSASPQGVQGPPRYPGIPGSPGVRPPPNNFVGPRPPVYNANQPQQIYYQPRNGDIRPPRPPNPEPGASPSSTVAAPQVRFSHPPYNPEPRQSSPQVIPETVLTPPPKNNGPLRDERVANQLRTAAVKEQDDRRSQPVTRQGQYREKMEITDSRSPTPGSQMAEPNRGLNVEEIDKNTLKQRSSPRGDNEDDDDDVVMDREKEIDDKSPSRGNISNDSLQPEVARVDSPSSPASSASHKSFRKSAIPSPVPSAELQDRPGSVNKLESSDQPPGDKLSTASSPVPPQDKSGAPSRSESRVGDSTNADLSIGDGAEGVEGESVSNVHASDAESKDDSVMDKRSESRTSIESSRSPIPPSRTPDHQATLSVPGSQSPQTPNSPKSPKSPQGSVKGFDNGQMRSLSPKSPTPSVSPASPNSPNSPAILKSADREKKTTTFVEDSEATREQETKQEESSSSGPIKSRPMTPGNDPRGRPPTPSKAAERAQTPGTPDGRKSSMKRSTSGRSIKSGFFELMRAH